MSSVTYHGEYPDGQVDDEGKPFIVHQGYTFKPGESVKVTDKYDIVALSKNRFFKTPDSDKDEVERAKDEAEEAETATLKAYLTAENVPYHHKTGLAKLRDLKADHDLAKAQAAEY